MIRISLGNVGSGKTACEVRELLLNKTNRTTYSNIVTRKIPNNKLLKSEMIIKKVLKGEKKKRDGTLEAVYDYEVNMDFWKGLKEPINVVVDEAHSIINARRSMSKANIVITDWLALIRRVIGQAESGMGELVFISQLANRIDIIARDMANQVRWYRCHYRKTCRACGVYWRETNDNPEPLWNCPRCSSSKIDKSDHVVEVLHFSSMRSFMMWEEFGIRSYHRRYFVTDIEKVFPLYDTLQWDNLFSGMY